MYTKYSSGVKASYWLPEGESSATGSEIPQSSAVKIDSTLFTHLYCAYADLDPQTHRVFISDAQDNEFSNFTNIVKKKNPHVQTLLSIGGRNADKSVFAAMASNHTSRKAFIWSSISIARSYNRFNGLDLAWEYPKNDVEMSNFGKLLEEWRSAVEDEAERSENMPLLLTASVYYSSDYNSVSYPILEVEENLDWVNLIAYDFYGSSSIIGPPAALFDPLNPAGPCGDSGLKQWIKAGLPEDKIVLGIPYVGRTWSLQDGYDPASTRLATSADGSINYNQIKRFIVDNKATTVYDSKVVGDYSFSGTSLIGYDDKQSVVTKVRYAKQRSLGGYFSWNVGADDDSTLSRASSQAWDSKETTTRK